MALRESEDRYHRLFDAMTEGFLLMELIRDAAGTPVDFRILEANRAYESVLGCKREDAIGRTLFEQFPGLARDRFEAIAAVAQTGEPLRWRGIFQPTGRYYENFYYSPRPGQLAGIFMDITEHKRAEERLRESESRFRSLFENSPDAIFLAIPGGPVTHANPAACAVFKMTEDELCRAGRKGIEDPTDPRHQAAVAERAHSGKVRYEATHVRKDGSKFPSEVSSVIVEGGTRSVVILRDITERKRAEEALKTAYEEMEARVEERTADLKRLNEAMSLTNKALEDFSHVASHDLQEPLRKIMTFSERLAHSDRGSLSDQSRDYLTRIQQAAARMQTLIHDLAKYSRVTSSSGHFKVTNLKKSAKEAVEDLTVLLEETEGRVEIGELPDVKANETQMRHLFQNLIGNALKYRSNQHPLIKIYSVYSSEEGFHKIHIEDNGIGFDEIYLDKIFKPFQRLHGKSSPYEGTGMGLAICQKIVEFHGGSITAKSEPGKGSTFIIRLPKTH
jgi:PAS domain S-box-containing protein